MTPLPRCAVLTALVLSIACRSTDAPVPEPSVARAAEPGPLLERPSFSPFAAPVYCSVDHEGPFLDLGTDTSHSRRSFALGPVAELGSESFSDQSYTRFDTARAHYDFWLNDVREGLQVRVRARAGSSASLTASVDQHPLGSVRLRGDGFQTLAFPALKQALGPGRHELSLRWSGRRADARPLGMLEWIHWAEPGRSLEGYRPPRERSRFGDVVAGQTPRRALNIETPGSLRCPVQISRGTQLSLGLAYAGEGEAVARVTAMRDGASELTLVERRVTGGAGAGWIDLKLDLAAIGPELVQLELRATTDRKGARVSFSEPRIEARAPAARPTPAKIAILLVASGLHREFLPPFAGARQLPRLTQLAEASVRFPEYRVPTTLVGGVLATLLTGLPPLAHGLTSADARLPSSVLTLGDRMRENSGESALFSGAPETRAAFGFERGFQYYESFSPVQDISASEPLVRARAWLEQAIERDREPRRLLVLHTRGAHPPWDLSREEISELEPREYNGLLEPRRGGIILSNVRTHSRLAQRRLSGPDWTRLRALSSAALAKQDLALGELIELLERAGLWQDTLFIFAGDVAAGDPPEAPFGANRALREEHLIVPLWIKFPGVAPPSASAAGLVTSGDVARTIADALGVTPPEDAHSLNLERLARGEEPPAGRSALAMRGANYALRWGRWLMRGKSPSAPVLCELSVDPACAHDVLLESPLAAEALWRATFEEHRRQGALEGRARAVETAVIDPDTAAALEVWGD